MKDLLRMSLSILLLMGSISAGAGPARAEEKGSPQGVFVIREAKEFSKTTVGVEAYLIDNILEVKMVARMYGTKPLFYNALVVGSGLGRLSIETKDVLLQSVEEDAAFLVTKKDRAFLDYKKRKKTKKPEGTLTRELVRFDIPHDKVRKDKTYRLWVQVESMQRGGRYKTFKFDLKNEESDKGLAELMDEAAELAAQE